MPLAQSELPGCLIFVSSSRPGPLTWPCAPLPQHPLPAALPQHQHVSAQTSHPHEAIPQPGLSSPPCCVAFLFPCASLRLSSGRADHPLSRLLCVSLVYLACEHWAHNQQAMNAWHRLKKGQRAGSCRQPFPADHAVRFRVCGILAYLPEGNVTVRVRVGGKIASIRSEGHCRDRALVSMDCLKEKSESLTGLLHRAMTHMHAGAFSFEQHVMNVRCCYVLYFIYKTRLEKSESSQSSLPGFSISSLVWRVHLSLSWQTAWV